MFVSQGKGIAMPTSPSDAIRAALPEIQARLKAELDDARKAGHCVSAIEGENLVIKRTGQRQKIIPLDQTQESSPVRRAA
jgi:hypothetical protein